MQQLYLKTRKEWRDWLSRNHDTNPGVWLVIYKKETGKPALGYEDLVEEALCFGWIDSTIKKLDEEKYLRKLTPRKPKSRWSELNKKRIAKLEEQNLITEAGLEKIRAAKASGLWDKPDRPQISFDVPVELEEALSKNEKARLFFDQLAPSYRKQFIGWIAIAKQPATKEKRVDESIALLEKGEKLGMR